MRIVIHREDGSLQIGQRDDGQWVMRSTSGDGQWTPIAPPAWASPAREEPPAHPMTDPYERSEGVAGRVTVRRVSEKVVYDYEAAVLVRNGWEIGQTCPDCASYKFGNFNCANCRAVSGIDL